MSSTKKDIVCTYKNNNYTFPVAQYGKIVNVHSGDIDFIGLVIGNQKIGSGFPKPKNGEYRLGHTFESGFFRIIITSSGDLYINSPIEGNARLIFELTYVTE